MLCFTCLSRAGRAGGRPVLAFCAGPLALFPQKRPLVEVSTLPSSAGVGGERPEGRMEARRVELGWGRPDRVEQV